MAEIVLYKCKDSRVFLILSRKYIQIILASHLPIVDFDHLSRFCHTLAVILSDDCNLSVVRVEIIFLHVNCQLNHTNYG